MNNIKQEFVKYLVVGGLAFLGDFFSLAFTSQLLGFNYHISILIAFLLGTWINYTLSVNWVFSYRTIENQKTEFSLFVLIGILNLGFSLSIITTLVEYFNLHLLTAKSIATGLTFITNFAGRRILLFRPPNLVKKFLISSN